MHKTSRDRYLKKKNHLENGINKFLFLLIVFVFFPIFITTFFQRLKIQDLIFVKPEQELSEVEKKLPAIVAKQISIHMPDECIKAQCVIARTNAIAAKEKGESEMKGFSTAELQELWGTQYDSYYKKIESLVNETAGETLQYDGSYIYAAYHQASAGNTRNMQEYSKKNLLPYLEGVECHEDTMSEGYLNVYFWTKEEFLELFKNLFPEETIAGGGDVKILTRDKAGYALQVQVGQTIYEGEEFRKTLALPSACFEITLVDEDIRIVTMGQGHGFGLSQYTAKKMAESGKNYQEILTYFYKGAVIAE